MKIESMSSFDKSRGAFRRRTATAWQRHELMSRKGFEQLATIEYCLIGKTKNGKERNLFKETILDWLENCRIEAEHVVYRGCIGRNSDPYIDIWVKRKPSKSA